MQSESVAHLGMTEEGNWQQPQGFLDLVLARPAKISKSDTKLCKTRQFPGHLDLQDSTPGDRTLSISGGPESGKMRWALGGSAEWPFSASLPLLVPRERMPTSFEEACSNQKFTINPKIMGFLPGDAWKDEEVQFWVVVSSFFRKKNSNHCKFAYKLYNALLLTETVPELFPVVGIRWITETVFIVEKNTFAKLLGVRSIDGSLFHQQGNFPSHGFVELSFQESSHVAQEAGMTRTGHANYRFLKHASDGFSRQSGEQDIQNLKWIRS